MKSLYVTLLFILVVASPSLSQGARKDKPVGDVKDRTNVNGFGARLVVVENPRQFIKEWLKPEIPKIKRWSATEMRRGDSLGAFILFIGCKTDAHGICDSEVDYTIHRPDGSIYDERKGQPLWKEVSPAPNLQLSRGSLEFRIGKDEPSGKYKVEARVSDLNANLSFELEMELWLK
jgi:hypothetical protein